MDLISVIVPVYKVEKYLDRCVESIVNQTYRNLEIILVDDGSPDNCGAMCDAWAAKDSRIKVIHKENGGLSDARNTGMAVATGQYIGFIDSDDFISPEMYQLLLDRLVTDHSDISACGVEMVYENGTPSQPLTCSGYCLLSQEQAMAAVIDESWLKQPVWYKLYKTELIKDIPFPVGKYHEDVFWTYQVVARVTTVSVFDTPCYYYLQRRSSIMGERFSLRRLDALEAKCLRYDYLQQAFPSLVPAARTDLFYTQLYLGQQAQLCPDKSTQQIAFQQLKAVQKKYPLTPKDWSALPLTHKVWALMALISLPLACRLRNLMGVGR